MTVADADRDVDHIHLSAGAHAALEDGACVMELASYLAHEPWSDHPLCVSRCIGTFVRPWHDALDDETRQLLRPYAARLIGTNTGPEDDARRAWLATDWLVRTFAPAWLDLAGLGEQAAALRALPELNRDERVPAALRTILAARAAAGVAARAARAAAGVAAEAAAGVAAEAAAWDAAEAAAEAAAWDVAEAARAAAWDAAWDVARAAAWDVARDAGRDAAEVALRPTVMALQGSAFDLLDRMIGVGRPEPAS